MASSFSSSGVPPGEDTQGVAVGWIAVGPSGRRTHPFASAVDSCPGRLSFRQPPYRRIGGGNKRVELETCSPAIQIGLPGFAIRGPSRSRVSQITKNSSKMGSPRGQPGFGRWNGPFRSVRIGKKRKRSHILSSGLMAESQARGCAANEGLIFQPTPSLFGHSPQNDSRLHEGANCHC